MWINCKSEAHQAGPNFCHYHKRRGHNLEQCVAFRKLFDQKLGTGEILFQNEAQNVHNKPFPSYHDGKGKAK